MSEFKYACPVCGQHIRCDSSQAGSVMECPTCFQKITVPQAPSSDDQKFILTGSKVTEKKISVPVHAGGAVVPEKKFPAALLLVLLLAACVAGAAVFVFRGKIFKSSGPAAPAKQAATSGNGSPPPAPKPEKAAVVAPPANDTNWMLVLNANAIPDSPVAGRIHGQDFLIERANFSTNGTLTLRAGTKGALEFGVQINFGGAQAESLAGQTLNVESDTDKAAKISLRWKDGGGTIQKANYDSGYAMQLEFGALVRNRLPGKIYLCTPDPEKSYLMGKFNAVVSKPKPAQ
jgi:DNA-directed RNA polymerase subunit RPC12/RpoP